MNALLGVPITNHTSWWLMYSFSACGSGGWEPEINYTGPESRCCRAALPPEALGESVSMLFLAAFLGSWPLPPSSKPAE